MAILEKAQLLNTFPWQFITHGKSDLHIIIISNARKTGQKTCSATPSSVNLGIYIQEEQLLLTHKLFRTALTEKKATKFSNQTLSTACALRQNELVLYRS